MQELKDHFTKLIETPDRLHLWRKKAWDRLEEQTVSLDAPLPPIALCPGGDHVPEENTFVFVDGFFQGAKLPSPIVCMKMDAALLVYGAFLQNRWNRSLAEEKDPFALMNGALQGRGAFLYVPPNARLEAPLRMIHRFTAKTMAFPRLQIFLGKGSSLKIIEKTEGDIFSLLCNTHIDVSLDSGSSLTFLNESRASPQARYFSSLRASLKRDSCLQSLVLSDGALFSRHSVRVQLLEENSEALLRGLWRLSGERQSHTNVLVEHIAPHCRSRQHFKGVLGDRSRSSFEGKIFVRPEAQKTEAYQINNNLSLSDEAVIITKPNLEIFADDVKASHGATVSQLNAEDLFYLRSRGISEARAKEMLVEGFCAEILKHRFES